MFQDNKIREVNAGQKYDKSDIANMLLGLSSQRVYKKEKKKPRGILTEEIKFRSPKKEYICTDIRGKVIKKFWTLGERSNFIAMNDFNIPEEKVEVIDNEEFEDVEY